MRRLFIVSLFALLLFAPAHLGTPARAPGGGLGLAVDQAEARRFGGFRSFGFRGSRGFGGFGRRGFSRRSNFGSRSRAFSRRPLQRRSLLGGGLGSGLFAGIGGFLLGGMLGRMMFGGMGGYGMGGGFGLLEILLIGGAVFLIFRMMRSRAASSYEAPRYAGEGRAGADPYGVGGHEHEEAPRGGRERGGGAYRGPDIGPARGGGASGVAPRRDSGAEEALRKMAEADSSFSEEAFLNMAKENFLRFQQAWSARDLAPVRELMDDEIYAEVERDIEGLRREGKVNRLDNVEIERAEVVEAWSEEGYDFITVRYEASLCDYVVREGTGEVLEGSRAEPERFSERWTWVRARDEGRWFLSAIEQD